MEEKESVTRKQMRRSNLLEREKRRQEERERNLRMDLRTSCGNIRWLPQERWKEREGMDGR